LKAVKLVVAAMMVIAMMSLGGVALAQEGSGEQPPVVQPDRINRPGPSNPDVAPTIQERGGTALPLTGSDITLFVLVGAGAVGLGTIVLRASKARKVEA
jgi:LPXTG-motif cell wall-anchored protein